MRHLQLVSLKLSSMPYVFLDGITLHFSGYASLEEGEPPTAREDIADIGDAAEVIKL